MKRCLGFAKDVDACSIRSTCAAPTKKALGGKATFFKKVEDGKEISSWLVKVGCSAFEKTWRGRSPSLSIGRPEVPAVSCVNKLLTLPVVAVKKGG